MSKSKIAIVISLLQVVVIVCVIILCGNKGKKEKNEANGANTKVNETKEVEYEEYVQVKSDGTKLNKSEPLNKDKTLGSLVFTDIQLTNKNGQTVLLATVTNTVESSTEMKEVNIIVLDKTGKELGTVVGVVIPLSPGQKTQFNSSTQIDYANAYDFKIVERK